MSDILGEMGTVSWWTVSINGRDGPRDAALCTLARQAFRSGRLPRRDPNRNGAGAPCAVCGNPSLPITGSTPSNSTTQAGA